VVTEGKYTEIKLTHKSCKMHTYHFNRSRWFLVAEIYKEIKTTSFRGILWYEYRAEGLRVVVSTGLSAIYAVKWYKDPTFILT